MKSKIYLLIAVIFTFVGCASKKDGVNSSDNDLKGVKDKIIVSFSTNMKMGKGTLIQQNQLSIMMSTKFSGKITDQEIREGKWKNITKRFKLSALVEDGASTSTSADISDLADKGKPLYIAFRYETPGQTPQYGYMRWQVKNLKVSQEIASGNKVLFSQSKSALDLYHKGIFEPGRCVSTNSQVVFRGNIKKPDIGSPTEDWAITQSIIPI